MEGRCTIFLKVTTQIVQIKIVAVLKKKKKGWKSICFCSAPINDASRVMKPFLLVLVSVILMEGMCVRSVVASSATPWTLACWSPLSVRFSQARILEWVVISSSRGSSQPRDQTWLLNWQADSLPFIYMENPYWCRAQAQLFSELLYIPRRIAFPLNKRRKQVNFQITESLH